MAEIRFCDMSSLGKLRISGTAAHDFIRIMFTADLAAFDELGSSAAALLLTGEAQVIDAVVIIRTGDTEYMVTTLASTVDEAYAWLEAHGSITDDKGPIFEGLVISNETQGLADLVLFGPGSRAVLDELAGGSLADFAQTGRLTMAQLDTVVALVFDTPVVPGEAYELFVAPKDLEGLTHALLSFSQIDPMDYEEYLALRQGWGTWFAQGQNAEYTFPPVAGLMHLVRPSMDFVGGSVLKDLVDAQKDA